MKAVRGFLISQIGSILGSTVTDYVLIWLFHLYRLGPLVSASSFLL